jgi:hypothetical protein
LGGWGAGGGWRGEIQFSPDGLPGLRLPLGTPSPGSGPMFLMMPLQWPLFRDFRCLGCSPGFKHCERTHLSLGPDSPACVTCLSTLIKFFYFLELMEVFASRRAVFPDWGLLIGWSAMCGLEQQGAPNFFPFWAVPYGHFSNNGEAVVSVVLG